MIPGTTTNNIISSSMKVRKIILSFQIIKKMEMANIMIQLILRLLLRLRSNKIKIRQVISNINNKMILTKMNSLPYPINSKTRKMNKTIRSVLLKHHSLQVMILSSCQQTCKKILFHSSQKTTIRIFKRSGRFHSVALISCLIRH